MCSLLVFTEAALEFSLTTQPTQPRAKQQLKFALALHFANNSCQSLGCSLVVLKHINFEYKLGCLHQK